MSQSKEYEEGFASKMYSNPYQWGTREFNDFERGWVQRLKRNIYVEVTWKDNDEFCALNRSASKLALSRTPPPKLSFKDLLDKYGHNKSK